jgi:hypothetical protein
MNDTKQTTPKMLLLHLRCPWTKGVAIKHENIRISTVFLQKSTGAEYHWNFDQDTKITKPPTDFQRLENK